MSSPGGAFASFINEFSSKDQGISKDIGGDAGIVKAVPKRVDDGEGEKGDMEKKENAVAKEPQMMQEEERTKGSVDWSVYRAYLRAGRSGFLAPLFLVALVIWQGTQVMSSYWLVFPNTFFMAHY